MLPSVHNYLSLIVKYKMLICKWEKERATIIRRVRERETKGDRERERESERERERLASEIPFSHGVQTLNLACVFASSVLSTHNCHAHVTK